MPPSFSSRDTLNGGCSPGLFTWYNLKMLVFVWNVIIMVRWWLLLTMSGRQPTLKVLLQFWPMSPPKQTGSLHVCKQPLTRPLNLHRANKDKTRLSLSCVQCQVTSIELERISIKVFLLLLCLVSSGLFFSGNFILGYELAASPCLESRQTELNHLIRLRNAQKLDWMMTPGRVCDFSYSVCKNNFDIVSETV